MLNPEDPAYAGQRHYTRRFLRIYDPLVLGFFGRFVWRCPTDRLVEHYRRNISPTHLDVGPGTGYFLERAVLPVGGSLTLLDPNPHVLAHASERLSELSPRVVEGDVLKPLPVGERFESAALNYVIHCLPGPMSRKSPAVRHVAAVLKEQGVLFGATVLGTPALHTRLSRVALWSNNRQRIFDNHEDTEDGLRDILAAYFEEVDIELCGSVAVFAARCPRASAA